MSHFVVCVHATRRAMQPAQELLAQAAEELHYEDVLEERLLACGDDLEAGQTLLLEVLKRAEAQRPTAILTTCSMYTRALPGLRRQLSVPVVGIDEAMIEQAARANGPLALVGSIPTAISRTAESIRQRASEWGLSTSIAETRLVPADTCESEEGTRRLVDELRQLSERVRAVVVVQLSLNGVDRFLSPAERARILTSSQSALEQLLQAIREST